MAETLAQLMREVGLDPPAYLDAAYRPRPYARAQPRVMRSPTERANDPMLAPSERRRAYNQAQAALMPPPDAELGGATGVSPNQVADAGRQLWELTPVPPAQRLRQAIDQGNPGEAVQSAGTLALNTAGLFGFMPRGARAPGRPIANDAAIIPRRPAGPAFATDNYPERLWERNNGAGVRRVTGAPRQANDAVDRYDAALFRSKIDNNTIFSVDEDGALNMEQRRPPRPSGAPDAGGAGGGYTIDDAGQLRYERPTAPPERLYHGTTADVEEFAPGSHFGTRAAANRRLADNASADGARVYSVETPAGAYVRVPDAGDAWGRGDHWLEVARTRSPSNDAEAALFRAIRRDPEIANLRGEQLYARLDQHFRNNGFAGALYANRYEGGDSVFIPGRVGTGPTTPRAGGPPQAPSDATRGGAERFGATPFFRGAVHDADATQGPNRAVFFTPSREFAGEFPRALPAEQRRVQEYRLREDQVADFRDPETQSRVLAELANDPEAASHLRRRIAQMKDKATGHVDWVISADPAIRDAIERAGFAGVWLDEGRAQASVAMLRNDGFRPAQPDGARPPSDATRGGAERSGTPLYDAFNNQVSMSIGLPLKGNRRGIGPRRSEAFTDPRLSPSENKAVEMARNNYTNVEIAEEMDISRLTVGSLLNRARNKGVAVEHGTPPGRPTDVTNEALARARDQLLAAGHARHGLNQVLAERFGLTPNNVGVRLHKIDSARPATRGPPRPPDSKSYRSRKPPSGGFLLPRRPR